jgi:hypothetical protein
MPHRKRMQMPRAMTVHMDTPVEREFWSQYFNARPEEIEAAMAEVGNADTAIIDWFVSHRGTQAVDAPASRAPLSEVKRTPNP